MPQCSSASKAARWASDPNELIPHFLPLSCCGCVTSLVTQISWNSRLLMEPMILTGAPPRRAFMTADPPADTTSACPATSACAAAVPDSR